MKQMSQSEVALKKTLGQEIHKAVAFWQKQS